MFEINKVEFVNKVFRLGKNFAGKLSKCSTEHNISMHALVARCCKPTSDHMVIMNNDV